MKYLIVISVLLLSGCFPTNNTVRQDGETVLQSKHAELLREAIKSGCDPKEIKVAKSVREDAMTIRCKD